MSISVRCVETYMGTVSEILERNLKLTTLKFVYVLLAPSEVRKWKYVELDGYYVQFSGVYICFIYQAMRYIFSLS